MLAIIGGSALYQLEEFEVVKKHQLETPFGSSEIVECRKDSSFILFLPRHGETHSLLPHEINYQANVFALKKLGATAIISVSAVGSLREEIEPGDFVMADQYLDFTKSRVGSFFSSGLTAHVSTAEPVCQQLSSFINKQFDSELHTDKTYVGVEGPRFGTKAESNMYRQVGGDIIGMTNLPEAFLALEAQMPYASLCVVTDYDSWKETETSNVSSMLEVYHSRIAIVKEFISKLASEYQLKVVAESKSRQSLLEAVFCNPDSLSQELKEVLAVLRS